MLLAIHIGNTKTSLGGFSENVPVFTSGFPTNTDDTDLEFAIAINRILNNFQVKNAEIDGVILSCVVPPLSYIAKRAVLRLFRISPVTVNERSVEKLNIMLDKKKQLGTNLIADAAAVLHDYSVPALIVDMGTATSIGVIDHNNNYLGGMLLPGLQTSLNSLFSGTSIPEISGFIQNPVLIGKNTSEAVTSGAVFGNSSAIDACIDRIMKEAGFTEEEVTIVATGRLSSLLSPYFRHKVKVDDDLTLKGLCYIYNREV